MTPRRRRDEYITPKQAAALFAASGHPVSLRTITRMFDRGDFGTGAARGRVLASGYRKLRRDAVERYLRLKFDSEPAEAYYGMARNNKAKGGIDH